MFERRLGDGSTMRLKIQNLLKMGKQMRSGKERNRQKGILSFEAENNVPGFCLFFNDFEK